MNHPQEQALLYERVRRNEERLLDDATVKDLPASGTQTPHAEEWEVRTRTLKNVIALLSDRPRTILDVGCGNGWFSARLAEAGHSVTGLDTGINELEQAKRVFADLPINWIPGDPWTSDLPAHGYDLILFAASIQYFGDLPALLKRCHELLWDASEVLVVDSHFYTDRTAAERARTRSVTYYASISSPEMAAHYHHHTRQAIIDAAAGGHVRIIPPRGKMAGLLLGHYPFPIVHIRA